jgi:hypothetical protein
LTMYDAVLLVNAVLPCATQLGKPHAKPYSLILGLRSFAYCINHHSYPRS